MDFHGPSFRQVFQDIAQQHEALRDGEEIDMEDAMFHPGRLGFSWQKNVFFLFICFFNRISIGFGHEQMEFNRILVGFHHQTVGFGMV